MIKGIGLDIVEIDRIYELMNRTDKFQRRILSERELSVFKELSEKENANF